MRGRDLFKGTQQIRDGDRTKTQDSGSWPRFFCHVAWTSYYNYNTDLPDRWTHAGPLLFGALVPSRPRCPLLLCIHVLKPGSISPLAISSLQGCRAKQSLTPLSPGLRPPLPMEIAWIISSPIGWVFLSPRLRAA